MSAVDTTLVRTLMSQRSFDVSSLAAAAGLSRQAVHRFLKAGYDPFPSGFNAVASVLGVSPEALLERERTDVLFEQAMELLEQTSGGEARAFEVLPASIAKLSDSALSKMNPASDDETRLLAAAGEIAGHFARSKKLKRFTERMATAYRPGSAFFFGHRMMDAQRIVSSTPREMVKHNVFGAFELDHFSRHFE